MTAKLGRTGPVSVMAKEAARVALERKLSISMSTGSVRHVPGAHRPRNKAVSGARLQLVLANRPLVVPRCKATTDVQDVEVHRDFELQTSNESLSVLRVKPGISTSSRTAIS